MEHVKTVQERGVKMNRKAGRSDEAKGSSRRVLAVRFVAAFLVACIVAVLVLSCAFILSYSNHSHNRNGLNGVCTACAQVASAGKLIRQLSAAITIIAIIHVVVYKFIRIPKDHDLPVIFFSLVELKVRLNS